jgi:hypothetical protein
MDVASVRDRDRTTWSRQTARIAPLSRQTSSPRCLAHIRPDQTPDRALPMFDARQQAQRRQHRSAPGSGSTNKHNNQTLATIVCANNAHA